MCELLVTPTYRLHLVTGFFGKCDTWAGSYEPATRLMLEILEPELGDPEA
jgi:hypothetical protein